VETSYEGQIARIFPRRTKATPDDSLAFVDCQPPLLIMPDVKEVHVSVTFTQDIGKAEWLAEAWRAAGVPVKVGGPAYNVPGGMFTPGKYLKKGYVITSRGCYNRCWFCSVPAREGYTLRELPIMEGWNVLDDNLLACSDAHIHAVFDMLAAQKEKAVFTGGLEAKLLKPWHAKRMREIKALRMFFAYDTPDDYEPLVAAGKIMRQEGHTVQSHKLRCYVLIGYKGDTIEKAEARLTQTILAGFVPYAMLYQSGQQDAPELMWRQYQREWIRPAIVGAKMSEILSENKRRYGNSYP
jgi:hypothetical protein